MPNNWSWCRLNLICPYGDCEKVECKNILENDWILELEDIEKDSGKIISFITKKERPSVSLKHKFYKGQLLYSKLRPYLNKVVIAPQKGFCTSEILPLSFYEEINPLYMQMFLMSKTFLNSKMIETSFKTLDEYSDGAMRYARGEQPKAFLNAQESAC